MKNRPARGADRTQQPVAARISIRKRAIWHRGMLRHDSTRAFPDNSAGSTVAGLQDRQVPIMINKLVTKQFLMCVWLIILPAGAQAEDYLFAFLGGNARADLWLVNKSTGKLLLTETADAKTVADYTGHSGNIAFHHFAETDQNAGWLASHLIHKALPRLRHLEQSGQLEVSSLSFLYALAGLDAVNGEVPGYEAESGEQALRTFEHLVNEAFRSDGRTLAAMRGVSDSALILQAMDVALGASAGPAANLVVYADTYAIGFYRHDSSVQVKECFADDFARTPAGGFFQLGKNGSQALFNESGTEHLAELVRQFWDKQGLHYTDTELRERYQDTNRNELGGVLAELGMNPALWRLSESEKSILVQLVFETARDIGTMLSELAPGSTTNQKQPVVIIGFYADVLNADPAFYQVLLDGLADRYNPRLIHGGELSQSLAEAAVRLFSSTDTEPLTAHALPHNSNMGSQQTAITAVPKDTTLLLTTAKQP